MSVFRTFVFLQYLEVVFTGSAPYNLTQVRCSMAFGEMIFIRKFEISSIPVLSLVIRSLIMIFIACGVTFSTYCNGASLHKAEQVPADAPHLLLGQLHIINNSVKPSFLINLRAPCFLK